MNWYNSEALMSGQKKPKPFVDENLNYVFAYYLLQAQE